MAWTKEFASRRSRREHVRRQPAVSSLIALLLLGCGASSAYDRAWVVKEVNARTGHAVGDPTNRPSLPKNVKDVANLSEDDAVSIALWNSAAFEVELAQLGYARGDLEDAGALPNPTLAFLFPMGPRQLEFSVLYPLSALLHRPYRVAAAKLEVERTAHALVQTGLDLMRDVRIAYADLVLAGARVELRAAMAVTWGRIASIARARTKAGDIPAVEAAAADADAVVASDLAKRAEADAIVARARLRFALGLADSPLGEGIAARAKPVDTKPPSDEAALVKTAQAVRPDLRGAELMIESATKRLGWENARIVQFMARLDGKPIGPSGGAPVLLLPGFQAELPIFNWNGGNREKARADVARASFRYVLLRQTVATEIRIARATLTQAIDSFTPFRDNVVPALEKAVTVAIRSYEEGNESYVFVLEATRRLQDAKLRLLEIEADVRRARAAMDRNIGRRTDAP